MPGRLNSLRIGSIRYINSLPVDWGFSSGQVPFAAEVVRGAPSELNQKILNGDLEISPVSAFWYARHQSHFFLLPDISISSESGVQSVLLFSRRPPQELGGKTIAVTGEGKTTPVLLEILCRKFYGFKPILKTMTSRFESVPADAEAILLIGDEALTHREILKNSGYLVTDMAQEWKRLTGFGFVFAVWAVRKEFFLQNAPLVYEVYQAILDSKKWGLCHRREVIDQARWQTRLPEKELEEYFSCLSHDLTDSLIQGMSLYFKYALEYALLSKIQPPEWVQTVGACHG